MLHPTGRDGPAGCPGRRPSGGRLRPTCVEVRRGSADQRPGSLPAFRVAWCRCPDAAVRSGDRRAADWPTPGRVVLPGRRDRQRRGTVPAALAGRRSRERRIATARLAARGGPCPGRDRRLPGGERDGGVRRAGHRRSQRVDRSTVPRRGGRRPRRAAARRRDRAVRRARDGRDVRLPRHRGASRARPRWRRPGAAAAVAAGADRSHGQQPAVAWTRHRLVEPSVPPQAAAARLPATPARHGRRADTGGGHRGGGGRIRRRPRPGPAVPGAAGDRDTAGRHEPVRAGCRAARGTVPGARRHRRRRRADRTRRTRRSRCACWRPPPWPPPGRGWPPSS